MYVHRSRKENFREPIWNGSGNCARSPRLPITAAGGITTDEEIQALDEVGMHAALGMSIYRKVFPELFTDRSLSIVTTSLSRRSMTAETLENSKSAVIDRRYNVQTYF